MFGISLFDTQAPLNCKTKLFMFVRSQLYSFFCSTMSPWLNWSAWTGCSTRTIFTPRTPSRSRSRSRPYSPKFFPSAKDRKTYRKSQIRQTWTRPKFDQMQISPKFTRTGPQQEVGKKSEVRGHSCGTAVVYTWIFCGGDSGKIALSLHHFACSKWMWPRLLKGEGEQRGILEY